MHHKSAAGERLYVSTCSLRCACLFSLSCAVHQRLQPWCWRRRQKKVSLTLSYYSVHCHHPVCLSEGASDNGDVVVPYTFTSRDVILYALGGVRMVLSYVYLCTEIYTIQHIRVASEETKKCLFFAVGAEISQTNTSELKFLFEGHEDFSTIPSYAVLPAMVRVCILSYKGNGKQHSCMT